MTHPTLTKNAATVYPDSTTIDPADARQIGLEYETALNSLFSRTPIIGGYFTASVDSNVLTLAVKTLAGSDPSTADPVYVDFRHATQTNGASAVVAITAALSLTITAGATCGFTDAEEGRLWVLLFNDGGTPRLAVFNAYGATDGILHGFDPAYVDSSTAESASADSAGTIYTENGVTVSSKAFVVLGHCTWETPMATAGNWSAAPDVVHQQRWGDKLPGDLVQRQIDVDTAVATITTTSNIDDSIPQFSTEGAEVLAVAITPLSGANLLEIRGEVVVGGNAAGQGVVVSLHRDETEAAEIARASHVDGNDVVMTIPITHFQKALQQTSLEWQCSVGPTTDEVYFNGVNGSRVFNGVCRSILICEERMA